LKERLRKLRRKTRKAKKGLQKAATVAIPTKEGLIMATSLNWIQSWRNLNLETHLSKGPQGKCKNLES